jgi:hypothetical protein
VANLATGPYAAARDNDVEGVRAAIDEMEIDRPDQARDLAALAVCCCCCARCVPPSVVRRRNRRSVGLRSGCARELALGGGERAVC